MHREESTELHAQHFFKLRQATQLYLLDAGVAILMCQTRNLLKACRFSRCLQEGDGKEDPRLLRYSPRGGPLSDVSPALGRGGGGSGVGLEGMLALFFS